jgi:hypothetical protein
MSMTVMQLPYIKTNVELRIFEPNEGLSKSEDVNTLKLYLQEKNKNICRYIYIYRCQ